MNLVKIKEAANDEEIISKVQEVLKPIEYTRLDRLVDIVFSAAKDASSGGDKPEPKASGPIKMTKSTDIIRSSDIEESVEARVRESIVKIFREKKSVDLIKKSRAMFWSPDRSCRVVCAISKCYDRGDYWYAYHPSWKQFLSEAREGTFVLAFKDRDFAYFMPFGFLEQYLDDLYMTTRDDGKMYWHLEVLPEGQDSLCLLLRKRQQRISLEKYRISFTV